MADVAIVKVQIAFLEKQKETLAALAALPKNGPTPGADPGAAAAAAKKAAAFLGSEAAGKDGGFNLGKAAALVQAGVSGALAVMEAWRSGMQTLGPWAPAVAAAYAAAAAANALNLMNNIRKQQFGGGASPVFSAQPGTSIPAAAQAAAPAAQSPGQTTVVNFPEGMRDDDLFSGKMMRAFFKNLEEGTRNGGRVVFS